MAQPPRLQQRRGPSAQRVEDGPLARRQGHLRQRHVQQQAGELLVGLAGVLGDRHKILVEQVHARQLDRPQQPGRPLVQPKPRGLRRHQTEQRLVGIRLEAQVVDACDDDRLHVDPGGHRQLCSGEARGLTGVHAVERRREQHQQWHRPIQPHVDSPRGGRALP